MIKNVKIEDGCTSCGICEVICPIVFAVIDTCRVFNVDFNEFESEIREAADSCPVVVIIVE
jgi:ferredoxin